MTSKTKRCWEMVEIVEEAALALTGDSGTRPYADAGCHSEEDRLLAMEAV